MPRLLLRARLAVTLLICLLLAACPSRDDSGLQGRWAVDLDRTLDGARAQGATDSDLRRVRETFDGARMEIGEGRLTLSIAGLAGQEALPFELMGQEGGCHLLRIAARPQVHRYCRDGSRLSVHDPSTPLVLVYRRD